MNSIEIKLAINGNDPEEIAAAIALLKFLEDKRTPGKTVKKAPLKKVKEKPVEEEESKETPAAAKEAETVAEEVKPDPKESKETEVTLEQLRKLLSDKVDDHRDAVKKKLKALGATSLSTLKKEKYKEMFDFFNSL